MPTLFRLLAVVAIFIGLVFGSMIALVSLVVPESRMITVNVPLPKPKP
jgi:hypothetical protein